MALFVSYLLESHISSHISWPCRSEGCRGGPEVVFTPPFPDRSLFLTTLEKHWCEFSLLLTSQDKKHLTRENNWLCL